MWQGELRRHQRTPRNRAEGSVWLDRYDLTLLRPSRCTDRPTPARVSGQPGRGGRAKRPQNSPLVGSDDAEGRWAASRRCRGFAPSCGRRRSFDQGRSDLCSRHQQGSCGSSFVRSARDPDQSESFLRVGRTSPIDCLLYLLVRRSAAQRGELRIKYPKFSAAACLPP